MKTSIYFSDKTIRIVDKIKEKDLKFGDNRSAIIKYAIHKLAFAEYADLFKPSDLMENENEEKNNQP